MEIEEILDLIFSRKVILFAGEYGRGKTLSLCALNYFANTLYGVNSFLSNIPFNFNQSNNVYTPLIETAQFNDTVDNSNTMITVDEMQRYLDARDFNKPEIKFVNKFAVDLRKDKSRLCGSIQYLDWLEKRASQLLQIVIIPSFINDYGFNEKKEREQRLAKKDYWSKWLVIDKKTDREFSLRLNLYPFLNMYNTNFKVKPFVINHKEYIDYVKTKWSKPKFEAYQEQCTDNYNESLLNWKEGEKEL